MASSSRRTSSLVANSS
uniref:IAR3 n=1 Tax=Arundo donax TaxID=35708 RepID=A0A0A9E9Q8_ARUDO